MIKLDFKEADSPRILIKEAHEVDVSVDSVGEESINSEEADNLNDKYDIPEMRSEIEDVHVDRLERSTRQPKPKKFTSKYYAV